MEIKICPCCPRGCPISRPSCERGQTFARTGVVPQRKGQGLDPSSRTTEGRVVTALLRCGHLLRHGKVEGVALLAPLSLSERKQLDELLAKLLPPQED